MELAVTSVEEERVETFSETCWLVTDISLIEEETSSTVSKRRSIWPAISSIVAPSSRVAEELSSEALTRDPVLSAMPETASSIALKASNDSWRDWA